jgi:hypothetical protein
MTILNALLGRLSTILADNLKSIRDVLHRGRNSFTHNNPPKLFVVLEGPHDIKRRWDRAKKWLSTKAVEHMTLQRLADRDPQGEVRSWLLTIADLATSMR